MLNSNIDMFQYIQYFQYFNETHRTLFLIPYRLNLRSFKMYVISYDASYVLYLLSSIIYLQSYIFNRIDTKHVASRNHTGTLVATQISQMHKSLPTQMESNPNGQ